MKRWISLICLAGFLTPSCACARSARVVAPENLIATLPRTVRSVAPVFANGVRSDSIQIISWDGASLHVNGEAVFTSHATGDRLDHPAPAEKVKRAKRLGPREALSESREPSRMAGQTLAPVLNAIERGRLVFVGRGYCASIADVSAGLAQVEEAIERRSVDVPGPVGARILRDVIEASGR